MLEAGQLFKILKQTRPLGNVWLHSSPVWLSSCSHLWETFRHGLPLMCGAWHNSIWWCIWFKIHPYHQTCIAGCRWGVEVIICDVWKDCPAMDSDTSHCIPGFFGGQKRRTLSRHFCSSSKTLFRSELFHVACVVRENSPFLGLFHYPQPLVRDNKKFVLMQHTSRCDERCLYRCVKP